MLNHAKRKDSGTWYQFFSSLLSPCLSSCMITNLVLLACSLLPENMRPIKLTCKPCIGFLFKLGIKLMRKNNKVLEIKWSFFLFIHMLYLILPNIVLASRQTLPSAHCDGSFCGLFRNRLLEFLTIYHGHMLTFKCQSLDKAWTLPPNDEGLTGSWLQGCFPHACL